MFALYPAGTQYTSYIINNHIEGVISFFEDNEDRRAYCAENVGEVLNWSYDWVAVLLISQEMNIMTMILYYFQICAKILNITRQLQKVAMNNMDIQLILVHNVDTVTQTITHYINRI